MFDTMTMTKILGGFCGAFLVFLLGGWAAEIVYHAGNDHGDDHAQGYLIEVVGAEDGAAEEVEEVPFEEVFAMADAASGEGQFRACGACHALEPNEIKVGPSLHAIVGKEVGASADFAYSGALTEVAEVWTPENLNAFLENPAGWAPGTSMSYNGMRKVEDRADLIAYLATIGS